MRTPATADRVGLAVVAVSVTDIETAGAAAGGSGTVAIQIAGAVNVHHVVTEAHIDEGARINEDQTGAGADQSVNVNAGRTYHSLAVAGGLSLSGTVAVRPGSGGPRADRRHVRLDRATATVSMPCRTSGPCTPRSSTPERT